VLHGGEQQGLAPDEWQPEHASAFALNSAVVVLLAPFAEAAEEELLGALPPLALFGVGLAWVRLRSASVWPSFIAHAAYNGLGILVLVIVWATDTPAS
jgi:membrane protease YdiL (CAAX protease family)